MTLFHGGYDNFNPVMSKNKNNILFDLFSLSIIPLNLGMKPQLVKLALVGHLINQCGLSPLYLSHS